MNTIKVLRDKIRRNNISRSHSWKICLKQIINPFIIFKTRSSYILHYDYFTYLYSYVLYRYTYEHIIIFSYQHSGRIIWFAGLIKCIITRLPIKKEEISSGKGG